MVDKACQWGKGKLNYCKPGGGETGLGKKQKDGEVCGEAERCA